MFDVMDHDKPDGAGRGFIHYHINQEPVYVL